MIVAAILGKRVCDSLKNEAVLMCLYAMALLARVRFRANPDAAEPQPKMDVAACRELSAVSNQPSASGKLFTFYIQFH